MMVFSAHFVNCCPSNLLSVSTLPHAPFPVRISILYTRIYSVYIGVWRSGPQTYKHLPQSTFTGKIFWMTTFCIAFYESYISTLSLIPLAPPPPPERYFTVSSDVQFCSPFIKILRTQRTQHGDRRPLMVLK